MLTKRTQILIDLLKYGGLWLDFPGNRYGSYLTLFQIFRFAYLVAGWLMIWNLAFTKGIGFLLTPTAVFLPLGLNFIGTTAIYFSQRKNIEKVIWESEKNFKTYNNDWETSIIENDTNLIKSISDLLKYGLQGFGIVYMIMPVVMDLIKAAFFEDKEPYVVPLPLDGYFDQVKTRNIKFYLIIFSSHLWFLFAIPNTVSFQCLIFYNVSYVTSEIKIIKKRLRMLYSQDDNAVGLLSDREFHYVVEKHEQTIRLNMLQRQHITLPYMFQGVVATLSFCFTMFLINQAIGKDTVVTVLGCVFIVLLLATVMIMCLAGEYLEEMSASLFQEICNFPWYRQSPKVRKEILLMLMESNRTLALNYGEHFALNLRTYMQIINSAYSYYMLMKSVS